VAKLISITEAACTSADARLINPPFARR